MDFVQLLGIQNGGGLRPRLVEEVLCIIINKDKSSSSVEIGNNLDLLSMQPNSN